MVLILIVEVCAGQTVTGAAERRGGRGHQGDGARRSRRPPVEAVEAVNTILIKRLGERSGVEVAGFVGADGRDGGPMLAVGRSFDLKIVFVVGIVLPAQTNGVE